MTSRPADLFTPGPWNVDPDSTDIWTYVNGPSGAVAKVIPENAAANACLIAAAPDLYEALAALWNYAELSEDHQALATATLAKARGQA